MHTPIQLPTIGTDFGQPNCSGKNCIFLSDDADFDGSVESSADESTYMDDDHF